SENVALLPENLQKRLPLMIEEDWLSSYKQIDAIDRTFQRVSRRFSRENSLATAVEELTRNYTQFEADFQSFFPELIEFVSSTRDLL
ncbi:MAG: acyl carrier protein phosphodiesterase, partial [Blastocatellia bacterium]|nr:acyl carrier protein phosphodiesterase [Blastocatellia bacterium]